MNTSPIVAWLAAPDDFAIGAALYAEAGGSAVYRQLFGLGETSYSRQVLLAQLRLLAEPIDDNPNISMRYLDEQRRQLSDVEFRREVLNTPAVVPTPDPEALAHVRARIKQARDERSQLHAQLTAPRLHKAIRGTMAQRICALTTLVGELLATEAHLLAHGRLPGPVATADVVDAGELRRRLSNAISRRAKLRKQPDRASELPALEAEITLIREKLNTP